MKKNDFNRNKSINKHQKQHILKSIMDDDIFEEFNEDSILFFIY